MEPSFLVTCRAYGPTRHEIASTAAMETQLKTATAQSVEWNSDVISRDLMTSTIINNRLSEKGNVLTLGLNGILHQWSS